MSPLAGRTVVVTRATDQAGSLAGALTGLGAEVIELPVVSIVEPADGGAALAAAMSSADRYDWIVVTSPNGARRVAEALDGPTSARLAAVGPRTAGALEAAGRVVDLVPGRAVAEGLLEEFPAPSKPGARILLARAEVARDVLPDGLVAAGWDVDVVVAYRNVAPDVDPAVLACARSADLVTFTAESTVRRYRDVAGATLPVAAACIGPISAAAARQLGFAVIEADPHSVDGLVHAAVAWAEASLPTT
ncbi:MAG: uroporphyrinogen-III synthase [Acidimicrobiaceae bacterium]|nr:uroporphyrinogen-III synthase [Acidimicrobiaceae bacterium]